MFSHIEDGDGDGDESTAPPDLLSRGESSSSEPSEVDMMFGGGQSSGCIKFSICREDGKYECLSCQKSLLAEDITVSDQHAINSWCHLKCWDASGAFRSVINESSGGSSFVFNLANVVEWSNLTCFSRSRVVKHLLESNEDHSIDDVTIYDYKNLAPCKFKSCTLCKASYNGVSKVLPFSTYLLRQ